MHIAFELVVLTGLAFAMKTGTDSFQSSERVQNQQWMRSTRHRSRLISGKCCFR